MPIFNNGQQLDHSFPTSRGAVSAIAIVVVRGSTLELQDAALYPETGERLTLGVRAMLEVARYIEQLAALEGYTRIRITGQRLSGISPGRPVYLDRRIRRSNYDPTLM